MRPIYYLFMGMITGLLLIGTEYICITGWLNVRDRFQKMDEMGRELERLKWRQKIIEGRLRDWSRMRPRLEDIFRLHEKEIVEVLAKGLKVFEDKDRLIEWLKHPSTALRGKTPINMLDSRPGTKLLLDELGRIEAGVYS